MYTIVRAGHFFPEFKESIKKYIRIHSEEKKNLQNECTIHFLSGSTTEQNLDYYAELGFDLGAVDNRGRTWLICAIKQNALQAVTYLEKHSKDYNLDINATTPENGANALCYALL